MGDIYDLIGGAGGFIIDMWDNYKWFILPGFIALCWWFIWKT